MTMFETLWRKPFYFSPPVDDRGSPPDDDINDELNQETDEEREAREAQEAEDARIDALAEEKAKQIHEARLEQIRLEIANRQPQPTQPAADPNEVYQERLRAIAFEEDPVRQEQMRVELAEERLSQRFKPQLAHSAFEGAIQNVLTNVDVPENVRPYIAKAVRMYNVTPDQVSTPEGAMQVRRLAAGMAAEEGAYNPAPAPAPRTPNLRPAPVTSSSRGPETGIMTQLNDQQKAAVRAEWNGLPPEMRQGKRIEDLFSESDILDICAGVR